jgi:hypothetical protein
MPILQSITPFMRSILSEKNIVVILFVMVLITFSLAQEDSKKMEKIYTGIHTGTASRLLVHQSSIKVQTGAVYGPLSTPLQ